MYSPGEVAPPWKVAGVMIQFRSAAAAVTANAGTDARRAAIHLVRLAAHPPRVPSCSNRKMYDSSRNGKIKAGGLDRNAATAGSRYQPRRRCSGKAVKHHRLATTPRVL